MLFFRLRNFKTFCGNKSKLYTVKLFKPDRYEKELPHHYFEHPLFIENEY